MSLIVTEMTGYFGNVSLFDFPNSSTTNASDPRDLFERRSRAFVLLKPWDR